MDTWVQLHLMLTFAYSGVLQQVMDITEMSCASGTATTSSSGSTLMCIPKDPNKFIFEFTGFTAAVPVVVRPGVCIHNVLSVTFSLLVPTRLRIMLTWCMALLVVVLHVACVSGTPHRISWTGDPVKKALAPLRPAFPAVHCVGFEPWPLEEMHSGQVSTYFSSTASSKFRWKRRSFWLPDFLVDFNVVRLSGFKIVRFVRLRRLGTVRTPKTRPTYRA